MPDQKPFLAPLLQRLLDHAKSTIPMASFKPSVNDNINNIYWLFRKKESAVDLSGSAALKIFSRFRDEVLSSIGRSCGALSILKRLMSSHPRDVGENHTQVSTSCPMLVCDKIWKRRILKKVIIHLKDSFSIQLCTISWILGTCRTQIYVQRKNKIHNSEKWEPQCPLSALTWITQSGCWIWFLEQS